MAGFSLANALYEGAVISVVLSAPIEGFCDFFFTQAF